MSMVRLKNGTEVLTLVVLEIHDQLKRLLTEQKPPVAFLDIVMACRNSGYIVRKAKNREMLLRYGLVDNFYDDGRAYITTDIRNIVLASVEGDTIETMKLVSPLAKS